MVEYCHVSRPKGGRVVVEKLYNDRRARQRIRRWMGILVYNKRTEVCNLEESPGRELSFLGWWNS
jgi:hypothetical protein